VQQVRQQMGNGMNEMNGGVKVPNYEKHLMYHNMIVPMPLLRMGQLTTVLH
jgi:hypothetical protein